MVFRGMRVNRIYRLLIDVTWRMHGMKIYGVLFEFAKIRMLLLLQMQQSSILIFGSHCNIIKLKLFTGLAVDPPSLQVATSIEIHFR